MSGNDAAGRAREAAARDARARAAGFDSYGQMWRAQNPDKVNRTKRRGAPRTRTAGANPRASGTNTRTRGTNPRAVAANPRARLGTDAAFTERVLRRALARHRVATGEPWCALCDDSGWLSTGGDAFPCPPGSHRAMTTADADLILHPD